MRRREREREKSLWSVLLTHERAEGDDGQQPLDQHAEPVRQSAVIAALRIGLVDVRHVREFKHAIVQEPSDQDDPAVALHVRIEAPGEQGGEGTGLRRQKGAMPSARSSAARPPKRRAAAGEPTSGRRAPSGFLGAAAAASDQGKVRSVDESAHVHVCDNEKTRQNVKPYRKTVTSATRISK